MIALCNRILGQVALRQHRFDFLLGDPGRNGACRRLPVDAYYQELALVIEYRERQHSRSVPIMDRRVTISGMSRGEQRRVYDERRRTTLPRFGIRLVEIEYSQLAHDRRGRLLRSDAHDLGVLADILARCGHPVV